MDREYQLSENTIRGHIANGKTFWNWAVAFELVDKKGKGSVYFVFRVAASYDIEFGRFSVSPIVYVDFVGETETNVTYGLSLGWGF